MSFILMGQAMKFKTGSTATKMVLLKLADNANDDGECFPSYGHIAEHCEMSKRSVMRHIDLLIGQGLVRKEFRKGSHHGNASNMYYLNLDSNGNLVKPSDTVSPPSDNLSPPSDTVSPPLVTQCHPEPININLSNNNNYVEEQISLISEDKMTEVKVDRVNYDEVLRIYNETMVKSANVRKLCDKRKKLVKKFMEFWELDLVKLERYLGYMTNHEDAQWMFERRPKADGSGKFWNAMGFEYFFSDKCMNYVRERLN